MDKSFNIFVSTLHEFEYYDMERNGAYRQRFLSVTSLKDNAVDICGISEHFLFPNNVHFLDILISDYCYHANGECLSHLA